MKTVAINSISSGIPVSLWSFQLRSEVSTSKDRIEVYNQVNMMNDCVWSSFPVYTLLATIHKLYHQTTVGMKIPVGYPIIVQRRCICSHHPNGCYSNRNFSWCRSTKDIYKPRGKQATNMHLEQVTFDGTNNTSVLIRASTTILFGIHNLWFQSQMWKKNGNKQSRISLMWN